MNKPSNKEITANRNNDLRKLGLFELSKIHTRKEYRDSLNKTFGGRVERGGHKYRNFNYGNKKRAIGDYLWNQDRDMFEDSYRRWLEDLARSN